MNRLNEQGISRLLIIAGVALFVVLAVIAIFVLRKPAQKGNQSSEPELAITEWNVKFPMSEGNRDLYYKLVTLQGEGYGQLIRIYSKDIDDAKNANGVSCKNDDYPLYIVSRVAAARGVQMSNPNTPDYDKILAPFKSYDFEKQYAFGSGRDDRIKAPCLNIGTTTSYKEDAAVADKYKAKIEAIKTGLGQLRAIQTEQK